MVAAAQARRHVRSRRVRLAGSGATRRALLAAALALSLAAAPGRAEGAPPPTQVVVYSPFASGGALAAGVKLSGEANGYCWEGSMAAPRRDAWRCFHGNLILDPCFSASTVATWVACPVGTPYGARVLRLNLTKPLPLTLANRSRASTSGDPTTIRLVSGATCVLEEGATGTLAGMRLNYACPGGAWLVGDPRRTTPTWTILSVPRLSSRTTVRVAIAAATW
jgi:hypothetical protein